jgi:hypothetical protein
MSAIAPGKEIQSMSTAHCGEGRSNEIEITHLITVTVILRDGDAPAAILYDEKGWCCHGEETS